MEFEQNNRLIAQLQAELKSQKQQMEKLKTEVGYYRSIIGIGSSRPFKTLSGLKQAVGCQQY